MKSKARTTKISAKTVKNKVAAEAIIVKKEGGAVMGKVKKVAAAVNRKGKAAVHAIRIS